MWGEKGREEAVATGKREVEPAGDAQWMMLIRPASRTPCEESDNPTIIGVYPDHKTLLRAIFTQPVHFASTLISLTHRRTPSVPFSDFMIEEKDSFCPPYFA